MRFIPTSPSRTLELKKATKRLQRENAGQHAKLLDEVAQQAGYDHWHHVAKCEKDTERARIARDGKSTLSMAEVALLVESGGFPFAEHANQTGFFVREPDHAQRAKDQAAIVSLSAKFGIQTIDALKLVFAEAAHWSLAYLKALTRSNESTRWRSETDFLFFLVLIATQPNNIVQADLDRLGWSDDLAISTLDAARNFRYRRAQ